MTGSNLRRCSKERCLRLAKSAMAAGHRCFVPKAGPSPNASRPSSRRTRRPHDGSLDLRRQLLHAESLDEPEDRRAPAVVSNWAPAGAAGLGTSGQLYLRCRKGGGLAPLSERLGRLAVPMLPGKHHPKYPPETISSGARRESHVRDSHVTMQCIEIRSAASSNHRQRRRPPPPFPGCRSLRSP